MSSTEIGKRGSTKRVGFADGPISMFEGSYSVSMTQSVQSDSCDRSSTRQKIQPNKKKKVIFREDMQGFFFELVPLPVVAMLASIAFITVGIWLGFLGVTPLITYGFAATFSPTTLGLNLLALFASLVGVGGLCASRPPSFSWIQYKLLSRDPLKQITNKHWIRKMVPKTSYWRGHGLSLLNIGMGTTTLCLIVHFLAVNTEIIITYFNGHKTADTENTQWWPTGKEVGQIVAFEGIYIGMFFLYLGTVNCTTSLSRRLTATKHYRQTVLMIWQTNGDTRSIQRMASQESMDQKHMDMADG